MSEGFEKFMDGIGEFLEKEGLGGMIKGRLGSLSGRTNKKIIKTFPTTPAQQKMHEEHLKVDSACEALHDKADALKEAFWSSVRLQHNLFACDLKYDENTKEICLYEVREADGKPVPEKHEQTLKFAVAPEKKKKKSDSK